jgi:FkbM family methyltransferase
MTGPVSVLRSVAARLPTGTVFRAAQSIGVESAFLRAYWATVSTVSDDTRTLSCAGVEAKFAVASLSDHRITTVGFNNERPVYEDLVLTVREDDVFLDVGANVGTFTCLVGKRAGGVVAVEPHAENVERLRRNLALNDLNVDIVESVLWNETDTLELDLSPHSALQHSLKRPQGGESVEVPAVPGDHLVSDGRIDQPTVVKVDVEGAEMEVLEGLSETLSSERCRVVYCEPHPPHTTVEEVAALLSERGFETTRLELAHGRADDTPYVRAHR